MLISRTPSAPDARISLELKEPCRGNSATTCTRRTELISGCHLLCDEVFHSKLLNHNKAPGPVSIDITGETEISKAGQACLVGCNLEIASVLQLSARLKGHHVCGASTIYCCCQPHRVPAVTTNSVCKNTHAEHSILFNDSRQNVKTNKQCKTISRERGNVRTAS